MPTSDIIPLLDRDGLAVALIIILTLFLITKVWPWYTRRVERREQVEIERHANFMRTIDSFTTALNAVNVTMSATSQMIAALTDKIDDHHRDVMSEIRRMSDHD